MYRYLSDDTCVPLKFTKYTYKMICNGTHQCYEYRKKDKLRCKNRRRIDVNSIVVSCHHHHIYISSGDTIVDVPEHWQDKVKKGMNYEES